MLTTSRLSRLPQLVRPLAPLLLLVPFLSAADGGCSGNQVIGGNNTTPSLENPTGDCPAATESGDIACYSASEAGTQWVLDCEHPADRYYWRVYVPAASEGTNTAYMVPRPDGNVITEEICAGGDASLLTLFQSYGLCKSVFGPDDVAKINSMPLADALEISHGLHEHLQFRPMELEGAWDIAPWTLPEDLQEACPLTDNPTLQAKCDQYLSAVCGQSTLGVLLALTETEAGELAAALNTIYGAAQ